MGSVGGGDRAGPSSPNDDGGNHNSSKTGKPDEPERAAGPPGVGAPPSSASTPDTPDRPDQAGPGNTDDNDDSRMAGGGGGLFDSIVDTLSAPPTDASGNARSTSPVADRLNNTVNYDLDDIATFFGSQAEDAPALTPEQSLALEDGAAVIDGYTMIDVYAVMPASYPRSATPTTAPLSPLQGAAAMADAELAVSAEVYQRETTAKIDAIDDRISTIDSQLEEGIPTDVAQALHLSTERTQLTVERQDLEKTISTPDATLDALRGGDEPIGLSPEVLEKVVTGRDVLADRIRQKEAELEAADLSEVPDLANEVLALQDDYSNMIDLGMAYQGLVDQERKLDSGETVYMSKETNRIVEQLLAEGFVSVLSAPFGPAAQWAARLTSNTELPAEGQISVRKREDGVYDIKVSENLDPNATFASKISHYEVRPDGQAILTKEIFDGGNLAGNRKVVEKNEFVAPSDLTQITGGLIGTGEGGVTLNPNLRDRADTVLEGR